MTSFSCTRISNGPSSYVSELSYHVERVGDQGQRMHRISHHQFQQEEGRVDTQQDHNARRFREPHVCRVGARTLA